MITNRSLEGGPMKHFMRLKKYKASNVEFDCTTEESTSYDWWLITRRVKGLMLFNSYRYSVSTSGHQRKIFSLLDELGIKVDLYCQAPKGLQDLKGALEYHQNQIETLRKQLLKPRSRKETNEFRAKQIIENQEIVNKLQELLA